MFADGNLQLLKFGVLIIRDKDILQLKRPEDSTNQIVKNLFRATLFLPTDLQWYIHACEDDTELPANHFDIHDLTSWMINFILDYREQHYSLDGIHKIFKCLFEINQQVLSECREEWRHSQLFPLVYEYYRIIQGTVELYNDFMKNLKDISSSWLSVKLALEQIVARIRAGNYTRKVMLEQLNDLETANAVRFSDNFVIMFAYICKQTVDFSRHLNKQFKDMKDFKSLKTMAKASSIAIMGILTFAAKILGHNDLMREMKDVTSYSMWLHHLIQSRSRKCDKLFILDKQHIEGSFERSLCILDFNSNAHLLQELKNNVARSNCVINEYEEEIMIVIDKLQKKINSFSMTIDDMDLVAYNCSLEIWKAGLSLHQFVEDGNYLLVTRFGVRFIRGEDVLEPKRDEDSVSEAVNILCQATASIPGDLPWYVCACGADTGFHLCHSIIQDHSSSEIKFFIDYSRQRDLLNGIQKIFECLYAVITKSSIDLSLCRGYWNYFVVDALFFYVKLTSLLTDVSDSWLLLKLALVKMMVKGRTEECAYTYKEMAQQLDDLKCVRYFHADIGIWIQSFCGRATYILRHSNDIVLLKELAISIRGVLSVMAAYVGDLRLMVELKDLTSESMLLNLIQRILKKGGEWFDHSGNLMRRSDVAELQIWDSHGNVFLGNLQWKMGFYGCFNQEIEDEIMRLIHMLQMKIDNFSETIQDMQHRVSESIHHRAIQVREL